MTEEEFKNYGAPQPEKRRVYAEDFSESLKKLFATLMVESHRAREFFNTPMARDLEMQAKGIETAYKIYDEFCRIEGEAKMMNYGEYVYDDKSSGY